MRFAVLAIVMLAAPAWAQAPLSLEGSAAPWPWQRYPGWNKTHWDTYSTLAKPHATPPHGGEIVVKQVSGDAAKGQALAFDRNRGGGCVACHVMGPKTPETPGNVGPDLSEIGKAGRTDQWLYNYVYDARVYNPKSVMPPWGRHGFYSEAEITDMVAFLKTLKTPATFANPLDDPDKRPLPVEDRDALDPFVNPAAEHIEAGSALFKQACASCHAAPQTAFKRWAVEMPKWEPRLNKVLGAEEFIARHAKAAAGKDWLMQSRENTDLSIYLHSLANGEAIRVDLSQPAAKAAYERGLKLADLKLGQFDFACTDCHGQAANKWIRGQWLGEPKGQFDHFPLWRTSRNEIWDIRKRFQWCNVQVRANELPPDAVEYGELELYLRKANEGQKLTAPNIRH
jgi:sulfur-oxidizing protein SoxA